MTRREYTKMLTAVEFYDNEFLYAAVVVKLFHDFPLSFRYRVRLVFSPSFI